MYIFPFCYDFDLLKWLPEERGLPHSQCFESFRVQTLRQHVFFHGCLRKKKPYSFALAFWRMEPSIHFRRPNLAGQAASSLPAFLPSTHAAFFHCSPRTKTATALPSFTRKNRIRQGMIPLSDPAIIRHEYNMQFQTLCNCRKKRSPA